MCVYVFISESSTAENGKLNGHANGSVANSTKSSSPPHEAEAESSSEGTHQAFLSLEQVEEGQEKSSVFEVFKKVNMTCRTAMKEVRRRRVILMVFCISRSG